MKLRISLAVLAIGAVVVGARVFFSVGDRVGAQETRDARSSVLAGADTKERLPRINHILRERGVLESVATVELASRAPGSRTILRVVPEGTRVEKGQLLIELDASDLREARHMQQIAVEQARAALHSAEASLTAAVQEADGAVPAAELAVKVAQLARERYLGKGGELEVETQSIESEIAVARQRLKAAETALKQTQAAPSANDTVLERARLAVLEAKTAVENARGHKQLLAEHTRAYRTAALELALLQQKVELARLKTASQTARSRAEADRHSHKAALELAEENLKRIEKQIAACRIHSPHDGIAIYSTTARRRAGPALIEPGTTVREAQPLLRVSDLSRLQVRVRIHESRIARVRKGQRAIVTFDAIRERTFAGKVTSVGDKAEPGAWPDNDRMEYTVLVQLEEPTADLRLGLNALAEIDVGKSKDE